MIYKSQPVDFIMYKNGKQGPAGQGLSGQYDFYAKNASMFDAPTAFESNKYKVPQDPWYTKENFFNKGGPWDTKEKVSAYPYVWKLTCIVETLNNTLIIAAGPTLLSDLEAATLAANAQLGNEDIDSEKPIGDRASVLVAKWCQNMGKTIIDGSAIVTGSIGAEKIDVESLSAKMIEAESFTSSFFSKEAGEKWVNEQTEVIEQQNKTIADQQNEINAIGNRRLWVVYSASDTIPSVPADNFVENETWHTTLTLSDKWQSQKVANKITEGSWSSVIQISGLDGRAVSKIEEYYALSTKENGDGRDDWVLVPGSSMPTPDKNKPYLWNKEITIYSDNTKTETTPIIIAYYTEDGESGWSIDTITNWYAVNNDNTTAPGYGTGGTQIEPKGDWSQTPQVPTESKKYLWNYEVITYVKAGGSNETKDPTITLPTIIGTHGVEGKSISKIIEFYARSKKEDGLDRENWIEVPGTGATPNSIPKVDEDWKYLWNYEANYLEDNPTPINTTTPIIVYRYNKDGDNGESLGIIYDVYCYTADSDAESIPNLSADNITVDQATGVITLANTNWKTNDEGFLWSANIKRLFKYGREIVTLKDKDGKYKLGNITTIQSLGEMPKQNFTIYKTYLANFAPSVPNAGSTTGWNESVPNKEIDLDLTNEIFNVGWSIWASTKVDYDISSTQVQWSPPYEYDKSNNVSNYEYEAVATDTDTETRILSWIRNSVNYSFKDSLRVTVDEEEIQKHNGQYCTIKIKTTDTNKLICIIMKQKGYDGVAADNTHKISGYYTGEYFKLDPPLKEESQEFYYKVSDSNTEIPTYLASDSSWAKESDIFSTWIGWEVDKDNKPKTETYVWKIAVKTFKDGSIQHWEHAVLVPDLEAVELAAKYQIKNIVKVTGFYGSNCTFPIIDTNKLSQYDQSYSITGNMSAAGGSNIRFPGTTISQGIPEGDVGRWCSLYNRTAISGGAIVTGSITGDKIDVNSLTARNVEVKDSANNTIFKAYSNPEGEATNELAGWIIDETGIYRDTNPDQPNQGYKYGLNSDETWTEKSLASGGGQSMVMFYCLKKSSNAVTFSVLADGSLTATRASFMGPSVSLDDQVLMGKEKKTVGELITASGIGNDPGDNPGDNPGGGGGGGGGNEQQSGEIIECSRDNIQETLYSGEFYITVGASGDVSNVHVTCLGHGDGWTNFEIEEGYVVTKIRISAIQMNGGKSPHPWLVVYGGNQDYYLLSRDIGHTSTFVLDLLDYNCGIIRAFSLVWAESNTDKGEAPVGSGPATPNEFVIELEAFFTNDVPSPD